ncbi:MAG: hypothetical protein ACR5KW_01270 [Wolbachia sp.]
MVFFFKYIKDSINEDLKDIAEKKSPIIKLEYDELDKFCCNEKDLIVYKERLINPRKEREGIQIIHEKDRKEKEIEVSKSTIKVEIYDKKAQTTDQLKAKIAQLKKGIKN